MTVKNNAQDDSIDIGKHPVSSMWSFVYRPDDWLSQGTNFSQLSGWLVDFYDNIKQRLRLDNYDS